MFSCKEETTKEFYPNGILKSQYIKVDNVFDGHYVRYFNTGKIMGEGKFNKGKMDGKWSYYYFNGKIQSIQFFDNGKLTDINSWSKNGVHKIINGTGTFESFTDDNQLGGRTSFKDCKLHGKVETWKDGKIASEMFYVNGKESGIWKYWNEDGSLERTENYNIR